ncbi:MAG: hypothetical protein ACRD22_10115 [Terriglobia bacterium]
MSTQEKTARYWVEEKKVDSLFTVKDNPPILKPDIADLRLESFPAQHTTPTKAAAVWKVAENSIRPVIPRRRRRSRAY